MVFTIIESHLSSSLGLIFVQHYLGCQLHWVAMSGCPLFQQTLNELLQIQFLLLMFLVRPELPERSGPDSPEEARMLCGWTGDLTSTSRILSSLRGEGGVPGRGW